MHLVYGPLDVVRLPKQVPSSRGAGLDALKVSDTIGSSCTVGAARPSSDDPCEFCRSEHATRRPTSRGTITSVAERSTPRSKVTGSQSGIDIAAQLIAYLRSRLGEPALTFAEPPTPILGGFDTSIYAFELKNAEEPHVGPLVARVFRSPAEAERARYEAAIQNAVAALGYPAPEVLLVEPSSDVLGAPFNVMRRMPGRAMLHSLVGIRMGSMATLLGHEHARLHDLDAEAFRRLLGDAVDPQSIATFDHVRPRYEEVISTASLDGLRPALRWLEEHRPAPASVNAICHGDFHPLNVLVAGSEVTGVVDWGWVTIAQPELDVGATVALLTHGPLNVLRPARPLVRVLRRFTVRRYLRAYASRRHLDLDEVRYFEALRLFDFACEAGEQMQAEAGVIESDMQSPFFAPSVRDGVIKRLRDLTGTDAALPTTS